MFNLLEYKWNNFVKEKEEPKSHIYSKEHLNMYMATFVITVNKTMIDGTMVSNYIRKIPNVTTVSKDTIGIEEKHYFKAFYNIKFVLDPTESEEFYIRKILKKELYKIPGIRINSYKGVEKIS